MPQTFTDVACTVCGCVCDDLQVTIADDCVSNVRGACRTAEPWFAALAKPSTYPPATIEGQPASLAEAIGRAADIPRGCRAPLIWGLTRSSTAGQRAAVALAEQRRGTIDTTSSLQPAATLAFQNVGQSTCTLGEVRSRADLVIFWNTDPATTHPRHLERYSVDPPGEFTPRGRADRTVVVIDSTATETSRRADTFFQIPTGNNLNVVTALRQLLTEPESPLTSDIGIERDEMLQVLDKMKSCRYGALFFETGEGDTARDFAEAVLQLTRELNKSTCFTAHYIPKTGGLTGADNVLCWQTGFPFAVNFSLGYPHFNPMSTRHTHCSRTETSTPASSSAARGWYISHQPHVGPKNACRRSRWTIPIIHHRSQRQSKSQPRSTASTPQAPPTAWTACQSRFANSRQQTCQPTMKF